MNLNRATLFSIIAISYIFISRTMATFSPGLFSNLVVAQVNAVLSFVASLAVVAFYFLFYRDYVHERQDALKRASYYAVCGAAGVALLMLISMFDLFGTNIFDSASLRTGIPWLSSIFFLYFFVKFYNEKRDNFASGLKQAVFLAIIGTAISTGIHSYIFTSVLYFGKITSLWHFSGEFPVFFIPVSIFIFFTNFYFLLIFQNELNSRN
ncbi:MAG: hypothetical protein DWQ05_02325 [Calditrichaeota bacterium]|nr:MAG: hypothetical protein DWQ05_02325 [Calditrichota bacterium]